MTFEASLHGIDLSKHIKTGNKIKDDEGWLCVDPKDYEHLSKEEREKITKERVGTFNRAMNQ